MLDDTISVYCVLDYDSCVRGLEFQAHVGMCVRAGAPDDLQASEF